jgi:hypothetical protein
MNGQNEHCGKHDKIFNDITPCPGCETEKALAAEQPEQPEQPEQEKDEESAEQPKRRRR